LKDDSIYLLHILDAIQQICAYTADDSINFFSDRKTQDAVVRDSEIIGEAVKKLSNELKAAHPDIPWKRIAGMRDKLIHDYFGVSHRLVYEVVRRDLPELKAKVEHILEQLDLEHE
jgi:uncharacterized protein with HEPN domain